MLLYDELWFICESLCPENMRGCKFVHFLYEEDALPDLGDIESEEPFQEHRKRVDPDGTGAVPMVHWSHGDLPLPTSWDARWDNHSHQLDIGGSGQMANAGSIQQILFDLSVMERLGNDEVELIGNRVGQQRLEVIRAPKVETRLSHELVVSHVPNYLGRLGPYHEIVDDLRQDQNLRDFRRWVARTAPTTDQEAHDMVEHVERTLKDAQRNALREELSSRYYYLSIAKTVVTGVADALIPGSGAVSQTLADIRALRSARDRRYQGFLLSVEERAEQQRSESISTQDQDPTEGESTGTS